VANGAVHPTQERGFKYATSKLRASRVEGGGEEEKNQGESSCWRRKAVFVVKKFY